MDTVKEETKKYSTKSIEPAACILALGAEIVGIKRENPDDRFLTFIFESATVDMDKAALQFASKTLAINASDLLDAYKRLKSIIHSTPR